MHLAIKIAELWGLASIVGASLWIAAHGGIR